VLSFNFHLLIVIINGMCRMLRRGCTVSSAFLMAGVAMAACMLTSEGALVDEASRDTSHDTSDENDSVFGSIKPLESAVMPVSWTQHNVSNIVYRKTSIKRLVRINAGVF